MRKNAAIAISLVAILAVAGVAAVIVLTNDSDDKKYVYTTMSWQQEMVQEIVGDEYTVVSFLEANTSPHATEITPGIIASRNTVAYFAVGSGVEWEETNLEIIRDQQGITTFECCEELIELGVMDPLLEGEEHEGSEEGHDHATDPHVWASPERLALIAEYVKDMMTELEPDNAAVFEAGCASYRAKVDVLIGLEQEYLTGKATTEIIVWHPSWAYLLPDNVTEAELMEAAEAASTPSSIAMLQGGTPENPINVFLSEPEEINGLTQQGLCEMGIYVNIIVINILAGDWVEYLGQVIEILGDNIPDAGT
jgi:zinc transport system substrate-binding protein